MLRDLIRFANSLGLSVTYRPLKWPNIGLLLYDPRINKAVEIRVSDNISELKQVETIAHELAHFFLHYDKGDTINSLLHDEYEEQAERGTHMLLKFWLFMMGDDINAEQKNNA